MQDHCHEVVESSATRQEKSIDVTFVSIPRLVSEL